MGVALFNKEINMAIHIKDINEVVRIIRDTKKVIIKLDPIINVPELHLLTTRIDRFLDDLDR